MPHARFYTAAHRRRGRRIYPGDLLTTTVFRPKRLLGNYLNVRLVATHNS